MRGRLLSGASARVDEVDVAITDAGLRLTGGPVDGALWPYPAITRLDTAGKQEVRLALTVEDPDAESPRLVLQGLNEADRAALKAALPALFSAWRGAGRTARVVGLLIGLTAMVAGFVFFVLPALSGPIARATPPAVEARIGETTQQYINALVDECPTAPSPEAEAALNSIVARLSAVAEPPFVIDARIVDADFPNAFALPGGTVLVTDELMEMMTDPDQLAGVIAHEIAHVERRHVLAAVYRDLGLTLVLEALLGGGSGAGQEIAAATGLAFTMQHSRTAEREADALGLDMLDAAGFDPGGLAAFFDIIAAELESGDDALREHALVRLLRTHPDTEARADLARTRTLSSRPAALDDDAWAALKGACHGVSAADAVEDPYDGGDDDLDDEVR